MQDKQVQVFRNHPYLIIRRLIMIAVVVAVAIGKEIGKAIENETAIMKIKDSIWKIGAENRSVVSIIIILILMAAAFIVFYSFFIWKNSVIELHEDYILFFKRGLIVKKRNKVQYKNITNITIKGSLLSGIFRFKTVTCDINSTVTAKTDDYVILLGNEKAQLFRNTVLKLQKKSEGSGRTDKREKQSKRKSENINFQFGYSIKQKIIHILLESTISLVVGVFISIAAVFSVRHMNGIIVFLLVLLPIAKGLYSNLNRYFGYQVQRQGSQITISYGLVDTRTYHIEVEHISSVMEEQGVLARLFGYVKLGFEVIGVGNEKDESKELSLYLPKKQMYDYGRALIPEFSLEEKVYTYQNKCYACIEACKTICCSAVLIFILYYVKVFAFLEKNPDCFQQESW